jgi:hypothetical protein
MRHKDKRLMPEIVRRPFFMEDVKYPLPHELIGIPYSRRGQPSREISAPARIFSKPVRK